MEKRRLRMEKKRGNSCCRGSDRYMRSRCDTWSFWDEKRVVLLDVSEGSFTFDFANYWLL